MYVFLFYYLHTYVRSYMHSYLESSLYVALANHGNCKSVPCIKFYMYVHLLVYYCIPTLKVL